MQAVGRQNTRQTRTAVRHALQVIILVTRQLPEHVAPCGKHRLQGKSALLLPVSCMILVACALSKGKLPDTTGSIS